MVGHSRAILIQVWEVNDEMFYCMKCNRVFDQSHAVTIFSTGFRRVQGVDYHLGICKPALPDSSTGEVKSQQMNMDCCMENRS